MREYNIKIKSVSSDILQHGFSIAKGWGGGDYTWYERFRVCQYKTMNLIA